MKEWEIVKFEHGGRRRNTTEKPVMSVFFPLKTGGLVMVQASADLGLARLLTAF